MGTAATRAKVKWNSSHYTQIKVSVQPEIAVAFKTACASAGASMASVLSPMMAEYAAVVAVQNAGIRTAAEKDHVSTMKKRRNTVRDVTRRLEQVRDAETRFISKAPLNLQSAPIYEAAEEYVSVLEEIIEQQGGIY